jgi:hypothetical protein
MGMVPPPVSRQPLDLERKEFTCNKCGATTCCDGSADSYWTLKIDKCICGNGLLIKVPTISYGKFIVTRNEKGDAISIKDLK